MLAGRRLNQPQRPVAESSVARLYPQVDEEGLEMEFNSLDAQREV